MKNAHVASRLLGLLIAAAVAGAIAWGLKPEPVPVDVRHVVRGDLDVTVGDDGVTRIKDRYVVSEIGRAHV